jgi:hypothetical protein
MTTKGVDSAFLLFADLEDDLELLGEGFWDLELLCEGFWDLEVGDLPA